MFVANGSETKMLIERLHGLSAREKQILEQMARGLANKEIANVLDISPYTVGNHLRRIYSKGACEYQHRSGGEGVGQRTLSSPAWYDLLSYTVQIVEYAVLPGERYVSHNVDWELQGKRIDTE